MADIGEPVREVDIPEHDPEPIVVPRPAPAEEPAPA
jgi:hypothetical protein